MNPRFDGISQRLGFGWVVIAVCSLAMLAWLSYRAVTEWQQSAALLAERRAEEAAHLLATAITRDMRGVHTSVLSQLLFDVPSAQALDVHDVAAAFARYPYPEAFFAYAGGSPAASMTFYSRAGRPTPLLSNPRGTGRFPVLMTQRADIDRLLVDRITADAVVGRRLSAFDLVVNSVRYQVVALLSYQGSVGERLTAVVGFLVNMAWVRDQYFQELADQVSRMRGSNAGLLLTVIDQEGQVIAGANATGTEGPSSSRELPLLFFDPNRAALDAANELREERLRVQATVADDPTLVAARVGARRTMSLAAVSSLLLCVGLGLTMVATRAKVRLATMRYDFVSAVTHELKTPIAAIRTISETLASGRSTPETSREYARLAVNETKRLSRLIDNLLAYARITDITDAYSFEPELVSSLVQESLREFRSQLDGAGFSVEIDLPDELPRVQIDRPSMLLAIDNIIDNAVRYSTANRTLRVLARSSDGQVVVEVTDTGVGIDRDEIDHVTRKFYRGRGAVPGGTGLGLSISQRIISDHGGSLSIESTLNVGTTVRIALPAAGAPPDETDLDR